MANADELDTFDDLCRVLIGNGFSWVVDNVTHNLSRGITQEFSLPRVQESEGEVSEKKPRRVRNEKVVGMREYTAVEKLTLLLDEMERCLIAPIQIADELPKLLSTPKNQLEAIEIVDNDTDKPVFRVSRTEPVGNEFVSSLSKAIQTIRKGL